MNLKERSCPGAALVAGRMMMLLLESVLAIAVTLEAEPRELLARIK